MTNNFKGILKPLRNVRVLNFFRRIFNASNHFNKKYLKILIWGFESKEDTNYTYDLTEDNILYLAHTISIVTKNDFNKILSYINEARNDSKLKNYILKKIKRSKYLAVADLRCEFGRRLGWYAFARAIKPKIIIETGVDKGLGAVLLCSALIKNKQEGFSGQYFGTDISLDAGYLLSEKYTEVGKILYGDSIESLKKFDKPIDLFINDSDHSLDYEYEEYKTVKSLLHAKSIILGDNSHCSNKLAKFSEENSRSFLFFKEEPRDHWYPGAGIGISF
jgi:predicted O-methyltransferase YrrM